MIYVPEPLKIEKPWGYELFLISTIKGHENFNKPLSVYAKIIHANQDLSIQVHPNDKIAYELEKEPYGKTESWYILDADTDSYLYLGLKKDTVKEDFIRDLKNKKDITKYLNKVSVKKGDFFYIPAGLIHAIGNKITLLEPQQNSNTTYRVYDYNRLFNGKPRELHIDKALKSINFSKEFNNIENIKQTPKIDSEIKTTLGTFKEFNVVRYTIDKFTVKLHLNHKKYSLVWIKDRLKINDKDVENGKIVYTEDEFITLNTTQKQELVIIEV